MLYSVYLNCCRLILISDQAELAELALGMFIQLMVWCLNGFSYSCSCVMLADM